MKTSEFKKVARLLKEVYAQLEAEALSDGVDIFGEEYLEVRDALRLEVLKRLGFTLEEYREAKELVAPAKKVDVAQQALEASKLTQETSERIDALKIPDEEELLSKAKEIAEAVVKAPVIQNNIVERTTIEKPTIVKETVLQTVNEEYDPSEIFAELGYLNDKLENLVIPEGVDEEKLKEEMRSEFMEHLQENINMFGMPDFRKLAMGLQGQIDAIRNNPTSATVTIKDTFGITVDGGVAVLTTGTKGYRYIEQNCTITGWHLQANASGDVVFDVKRSGVSIAGTEKPTLTAQQTNSDLALTTWTTSLVAGDIIEFVIDSATTITRATLTILVTKI